MVKCLTDSLVSKEGIAVKDNLEWSKTDLQLDSIQIQQHVSNVYFIPILIYTFDIESKVPINRIMLSTCNSSTD